MAAAVEDLGPVLLFCPGDRGDRFLKARAAAGVAVLDLEDGLTAAAKDPGRDAVVGQLRRDATGFVVRINAPTAERGLADAAAVGAAGARALLLPKTESPDEVAAVRRALGARAAEVSLIVTIETARGAMALEALLAGPGVAAVSWGPYDLAADMGLRGVRDDAGGLLSPLRHVRDRLLVAAAAARVVALDTVSTELRDMAMLEADAAAAARLGFQGKFAIHPTQAPLIRQAFRPRREELDWSRRLLATRTPHGAFLFEGEMVDEPMLRRARRILALQARLDSEAGGEAGCDATKDG